MKVYRKYYDEAQGEEITPKEAVEKLEGRGYYKPGTVEALLKAGVILQSNAAEYCTEEPVR